MKKNKQKSKKIPATSHCIKWSDVEYLHNKCYSVGRIAHILGGTAPEIRQMLEEHGVYDNFECEYYHAFSDGTKKCDIKMDMFYCGKNCAYASTNADFERAKPYMQRIKKNYDE